MIGLGHLGLGDFEVAEYYLQQVLSSDLYHIGANVQINMIDFLKKTRFPAHLLQTISDQTAF